MRTVILIPILIPFAACTSASTSSQQPAPTHPTEVEPALAPTPDPTAEPQPQPTDPISAPLNLAALRPEKESQSACMEECLRRSQAVAMAWDAIEAQCERSCDPADRLVRGGADVGRYLNQRVTVIGGLEKRDSDGGYYVRLRDETLIPLDCQNSALAAELDQRLDREIRLNGRLLPAPPETEAGEPARLTECEPTPSK